MGQPIYFLPNLRADAAEGSNRERVLRERGLAEIFADVPESQQALWELKGRGPGGLPGCLLCYQTAASQRMPRRQGYHPEEQIWRQCDDGLWIGIDSAEPVLPEDLARVKQFSGYPLTLGDGRKWRVPIIRRSDPERPTELPRAFMRNSSGVIVEEIKANFRSYFDGIKPVADWVYDGGDMRADAIDRQLVYQWAVASLGLNYRFGWHEQNLLQLVDSECYLLVIAAACDLIGHNETVAAKKNGNGPGDAVNSTPGQPDDLPTMSQAGAIST